MRLCLNYSIIFAFARQTLTLELVSIFLTLATMVVSCNLAFARLHLRDTSLYLHCLDAVSALTLSIKALFILSNCYLSLSKSDHSD